MTNWLDDYSLGDLWEKNVLEVVHNLWKKF